MIDEPLRVINFTIALLTVISCSFIVPAMFIGWYRLRKSDLELTPYMLDIGIAKSAMLYWTLLVMIQIAFFDQTQSLVTLPGRFAIMVAAVRQAWRTWRRYGWRMRRRS